MRRIFALVLVALLLGVGLVTIIETDPGYLLLAYGNYTVESSLWVGLVLLLLFTLLVYALISLLRRIIGGRESFSGWLGLRRARRATRLTNRGLVHFIEGNWARARGELLRGARDNDSPLVNHLLAARASAQLGDTEQTEQHLASAASCSPDAKIAIALARAEIQLQSGHYQQAIDTLQEARRSPGRHPQALALLQRAYTGLGDGAALAQLLPLLKKHRVLNADEVERLEAEVYGRALQQAGDRARGATLDSFCDSWHALPATARDNPAMIRRFAGLLVELGGHALAEKTILRSLKHGWDPELVRIYGYLQSDNVRRQLAQAESWLAAHPEDPQLLLCLGRLAARDRLWGKSRDYFERSYRLQRSPEICAELGRLLSALGEAGIAAAYFREGLMLRESHLPALPRPEKRVRDPRLLTRG